MNFRLLFASAASAALLAGAAQAASEPGNLAVSATVADSCTAVSGTLGFGSSDGLTMDAGNTDGQGSISVTCTKGTPYTVELDNGANYDTTNSVRRMSGGGANYLNYILYRDDTRTTAWGSGTDALPSRNGTGSAESIAVYGRIPLGQNPNVGTYTDTVVISVNY